MILGLDISTSIVGIAVINPDTKELVVSDHIDLTKIDSVFSKAELVGAELWRISNTHDIENLFIPPQTWLPLPHYHLAHCSHVETKENTNFFHSVHFSAPIARS